MIKASLATESEIALEINDAPQYIISVETAEALIRQLSDAVYEVRCKEIDAERASVLATLTGVKASVNGVSRDPL